MPISNKILPYIIAIIPISLISGPFLADSLVVLSSLIFLYICFRYHNFLFLKSRLAIFLLFFYFYILFCSIISINIENSLESSLFYFRFIIFIFAVEFSFSNIKDSKKIFRIGIFLAMIILIIDAYVQYFFGYNLIGFIYTPPRLSSFFGTELILGSYITRMLPIFLAFYFLDRKIGKYECLTLIVFMILIFFLILLSGERAAVLYFILIILVFFYTVPLSIKEKTLYSSIFLTISLIFLFFNQSILDRVVHYTLIQITSDSGFQLSAQHLPIFKTSINMFLDNTIFGVGPKNFRLLCNLPEYFISMGCSTHSHNYYLQALSETGIIGFIFIFSLFIYVSLKLFIILFFQKTKNIYLSYLILAIFISLWPLIPTKNLFNNWINVIHFLPVGMILAELNVKKNTSSN